MNLANLHAGYSLDPCIHRNDWPSIMSRGIRVPCMLLRDERDLAICTITRKSPADAGLIVSQT